jgi:hypothetical protein
MKQISIFVENKLGRLKEVTEILAESGVDIIAHSLTDTTDFGVLRMIVDRPEQAVKALRYQGFVASVSDVTALAVEDRPGGFHRLLCLIAELGINFNYTYSICRNAAGQAVNIFHFDDPDRALAALRQRGAAIVADEELALRR